MMGREKGRRRRLFPSFSPYPSHVALPFLVPISPYLSCMKTNGDESAPEVFLIHIAMQTGRSQNNYCSSIIYFLPLVECTCTLTIFGKKSEHSFIGHQKSRVY